MRTSLSFRTPHRRDTSLTWLSSPKTLRVKLPAGSVLVPRQNPPGTSLNGRWSINRPVGTAVSPPLLADSQCSPFAVISALVSASGRQGLEIFLPAATDTTSSYDVATLPLVLPSAAPPLPENPRKFALRLIYRYSYSLGVSLTKFIMMANAVQGRTEVGAAF